MRRNLFVPLMLLVLVSAVFGQALSFDFVNYDDNLYVYENPQVRSGLSWKGLLWAVRTFHAGNWHPVTWLSHMLDAELFGLKPGFHHAASVALHLANALLLFLLLGSLTRSPWRSALVAALFAVHPLHVESVAWVSERKDVLSAFFFLVSLGLYVRHVRSGRKAAYAGSLAAYSLSLMSKPMMVTMPLVLLLLDWWPLGRIAAGKGRLAALLGEKAPFLLLAAASSAVTLAAQGPGIEDLPPGLRAGNALVSYAAYLRDAVWPRGLSMLYLLKPETVTGPAVAGALVLLAAVTILAVRQRSRRPWLLMGWAWYLVTLLPVIGLVPVGIQCRADRYTYVPLVGLFVAVAWLLPEVRGARRPRGLGWWAPAALCVAALSVVSFRQAGVWHDSRTLLEHALKVDPGNFIAHDNLGSHFFRAGDLGGAVRHFEEAVRLRPDWPNANYNLGLALVNQGRYAEAVAPLERALELTPDDMDTKNALAVAYMNLGRGAAHRTE